jgi:hypothetical protein
LRNSTKLTPYEQDERLIIIEQNFGKSYEELAELCQCAVTTIKRDIKTWKDSGGFESFLLNEWQTLHKIIREEDPITAYKTVSNLLGKTVKKEVTVNQRVDIGIQYTELLKQEFATERMSDDGNPRVVEADVRVIGEADEIREAPDQNVQDA